MCQAPGGPGGMRVVHVVQRFHPALGGAETHVRALAREQARRGHDVTVATSAVEGAPREETMEGYRVVRFPARHVRGDYLWPPWLPMRGLEAFLVAQRPPECQPCNAKPSVPPTTF